MSEVPSHGGNAALFERLAMTCPDILTGQCRAATVPVMMTVWRGSILRSIPVIQRTSNPNYILGVSISVEDQVSTRIPTFTHHIKDAA